MVIFKKEKDIREYIELERKKGRTIGFVPTMGALHNGHISLVALCRERGDMSVCSVFVNPTQFNDKSDLVNYPRTEAADIELLTDAGCDVLFMPDADEVYPNGADAVRAYDFGKLETLLEGAKRPGHFRGVGQVVGRLLDIVEPNRLYMGRKDYQQCLIVKDLLRQSGRTNTEMVMCPTVREADGLAMSSRNRRLTEPQRALAALLYQCLVSIQAKQASTPFAVVQKECNDLMVAKGIEPDYVELAVADTLDPLTEYDASVPMVALIAARVGAVRLIDNLLLQ